MNDREKEILGWMSVIVVVLSAQNAVANEWEPILKNATEQTKEEQLEVVDQYVRAIATRIVDKEL